MNDTHTSHVQESETEEDFGAELEKPIVRSFPTYPRLSLQGLCLLLDLSALNLIGLLGLSLHLSNHLCFLVFCFLANIVR